MVFVFIKRFFIVIFLGLTFLSMINFIIFLMLISILEGNLVLLLCFLVMILKLDLIGFFDIEIFVGSLTERVWLSSWDFNILFNFRESFDWNIFRVRRNKRFFKF